MSVQKPGKKKQKTCRCKKLNNNFLCCWHCTYKLTSTLELSTHLSGIRPLHPLHRYALPGSSRIPLLRHPLAVNSKRSHARGSSLVHAHGRPAHAGVVHGGSHAGRIHASRGASRARLVHELAVVGLSSAHLEGGTHLEAKHKYAVMVSSLNVMLSVSFCRFRMLTCVCHSTIRF